MDQRKEQKNSIPIEERIFLPLIFKRLESKIIEWFKEKETSLLKDFNEKYKEKVSKKACPECNKKKRIKEIKSLKNLDYLQLADLLSYFNIFPDFKNLGKILKKYRNAVSKNKIEDYNTARDYVFEFLEKIDPPFFLQLQCNIKIYKLVYCSDKPSTYLNTLKNISTSSLGMEMKPEIENLKKFFQKLHDKKESTIKRLSFKEAQMWQEEIRKILVKGIVFKNNTRLEEIEKTYQEHLKKTIKCNTCRNKMTQKITELESLDLRTLIQIIKACKVFKTDTEALRKVSNALWHQNRELYDMHCEKVFEFLKKIDRSLELKNYDPPFLQLKHKIQIFKLVYCSDEPLKALKTINFIENNKKNEKDFSDLKKFLEDLRNSRESSSKETISLQNFLQSNL